MIRAIEPRIYAGVPLPDSMPNLLRDVHGRQLHKLRVQLTDACQFRCFYCMPENATFTPSSHLLPASDLLKICRNLVNCGVDEIRLTGGEPLLRREFDEIVVGLSKLPLKKLGLTTNGQLLRDKLLFLRNTKCQSLNISLDSLRPDRFRKITLNGKLVAVREAIEMAALLGFEVKINMVVFRGINDDELLDFVRLSKCFGVEVRFLEYMNIGLMYTKNRRLFISADEMRERIEKEETLYSTTAPKDSTSLSYRCKSGARIGFIASESKPFCEHCSRLRLTANGNLRACLMATNCRNMLGEKLSAYPGILKNIMTMKPLERLEKIDQPMYQIGG
jgi:cyclic pyranopterin phosphate synthase